MRVTLSAANAHVESGEEVSLKASLRPPPEPISPNGFDFGRKAWFSRLGATGYAIGKIEPLEGTGEPPWDLRGWAAIDHLRALVTSRIRASLPGERGEIAAALITGERAGISEEDNQAMRDSGLFHMLSISGLHMVIMAGTVFWLIRAGLALIPSIALRYPIRKWAAAAALAAALFYLLLSGAAVPTVRSWIMMSIVLIAVLLDRPAVKASPRRAGDGHGCLTARSPSLLCPQARPMRAIKAHRMKRPTLAWTATRRSKSPSCFETRIFDALLSMRSLTLRRAEGPSRRVSPL